MIITCPHCQTKYQVTYEAIGSAGRKVQCAHCHQAWTQDPRPQSVKPPQPPAASAADDALFDAIAEDALDEAMVAEAAAAEPPKPAPTSEPPANAGKPIPPIDAATLRKQQVEFNRRQNAMSSSLPLAKVRRAARVSGIVILAGIVAVAWFGRSAIVERYPDMAGLYEAVGLGVNVVGLEFSDLATLKSLSGGNDVLSVSAQIVGLSPNPVPVPPVVISLLDESGHAVYEWSVQPRVNDLMAGERATFDTRLSLPPSEAVRVRLSFAGKGATSGERTAAAESVTATGDGGAAPSHAAPVDTHQDQPEAGHAAPASEPQDHAAEPAHAPAPAAADHH
ncbi:MJ0042 family finger-like domain-containing protein [Devosia lucknowensis]|uniref:MJ0042 family finger-like domain-containing protein n=1 Tax=Devosia lucknowensis TaxID=1096929 RepID=A0A1Y6G7W8_9HYPH|nr:zinc-ribbon domain-containing protein [Devosia lucknowensis]SMQ86282.1 MJ0042 family finger-like domain-containing protein [Devosia lucknowensis]